MNNNPANSMISILVNCRNGLPYLGECLDSIYNQTHQNFEIIFVDNYSTDGSDEFVKKYDERLKYRKPSKPMTLYEARNFGLQFVSGDYFAILDSDDYWEPKRLELQLNEIQNDPKIEFVYGNSLVKFEDRHFLITKIYNFLRRCSSFLGSTGFVELDHIISNYNINLQTVLISKKLMKDETFCSKLNYAGDMDFFLRLILSHQQKPYLLNTFISTTRVHKRQLSRQQGIRWVAELKYIALFRLGKFFTAKQREQFNSEIEIVRFQYLKAQGRLEESYKVLKTIWNKSLSTRIHFVITSVKVLGGKCKKCS